jgi:DNA-binding transcriptional LysR family regulator
MDPGAKAATLDWNDVRFFLAIARTGRLSKAAEALGVDQTTVGRRLAALEERFRAALFTRSTTGWVPTRVGNRILRAAEQMAEAAEEVAARALDDDAAVDGLVRIATSETIAETFVVPAIRDVQARHPALRALVSSSFSRVDLLRGEADLAVRLVRPKDGRLAAQKVAERTFRLYAARSYIEQRGVVDSLDGHAVVTYDDAVRAGGRPFRHLPPAKVDVAFQANSARVLVAAAVAGLGIVQLPDYVGDATASLVHVLPSHDRPYPIWVVTPQAKRRVAAIKLVGGAIADAFAASKVITSSTRP